MLGYAGSEMLLAVVKKNSVSDITPSLKSKMFRRNTLLPSSVSKNKPSKKPNVKQVANRAMVLLYFR
jgi:hypothetical protein